jgi:REP element-mobilizing transposase RayT
MHESPLHKGWHSRGYLPHLDAPELIQAITFRLADALPKKVIEAWKYELEISQVIEKSEQEQILRERIAQFEDAGHGACHLLDPTCALFVQNALLHFDGERYRLLEWCIMPNHVHVLIHCPKGTRLGALVKTWKTHSAREINRFLNRTGRLWANDYHDRFIRDANHLANARRYIRNNPVKAGLCQNPQDWPWSSAGSAPGTASL